MTKRKPNGYLRGVRVPRLTLVNLQARIRQLDAALKKQAELHAAMRNRYEADRAGLINALKDAVKIIEEERAGIKSGWTRDDFRRMEAIRFLSLGV